jgi:hypothetical protein
MGEKCPHERLWGREREVFLSVGMQSFSPSKRGKRVIHDTKFLVAISKFKYI